MRNFRFFDRGKLNPLGSISGPSMTVLESSMALDPSVRLVACRKTKIVATIGPASARADVLRDMMTAGIDIARINCAHGDAASYGKMIELVRSCAAEVAQNLMTGLHATGPNAVLSTDLRVDAGVIATAFDIKGPEIRVGRFATSVPMNSSGSREINVERGERLLLTTDPSMATCSSKERGIYIAYPRLAEDVSRGSRIYIDDGNVELEVLEADVAAKTVTAISLTDVPILERKGVNLPGVFVDLPHVTRKDELDIATAKALGADMLFASFVQSAEMVREIRRHAGPGIAIISKIENQSGIDNYDEILQESDGIMVARGDLGVQIPPERVFLAQKRLVARANLAGKPIICATQMLESMTAHPRPTRAECVDVASAVLDGTDAVMLSGETAKGKYPLEAVGFMSRICRAAETAFSHRPFFNALSELVDTAYQAPTDAAGAGSSSAEGSGVGASAGAASSGAVVTSLEDADHMTIADIESLASAAVHAAFEVNAAFIIVVTVSGQTAKLIAKYRPHCPVLCITSNPAVARSLQLHRGTQSIVVEPNTSVLDCRLKAIDTAKKLGIARAGDRVVSVHGAKAMPLQFGVNISMSHVR